MKPSYYANIPANVRYSNLKPNAKLLYGEITALSSKEGYCFATNNYFANLYGVTKNTISLWVSQLKKEGFVTVELIKKGEQITERRIGIIIYNDRATIKNDELISTSNINTIKTYIYRKENFIESVMIFMDENGFNKQMAEEFVRYWSELNKSQTKMRFELERTWNTPLRMQRWKANQEKWNPKPKNKLKSQLNSYNKAREMINKINSK